MTQFDLLYFAWIRERIGLAKESYTSSAATVRELLVELAAREPRYAAAFGDMASVRVAINQKLTDLDAPLAGAREIAFFPPMTGG